VAVFWDLAWLVFLLKFCLLSNEANKRKSSKTAIVVLGFTSQLMFTLVPFALMQWASPKTLLQGGLKTFWKIGDGIDFMWL
jgi:hypothetical protein